MAELRAAAEVRARGVQLDLQVGEGRTLGLVGPNGAGKSSAVQIIAGLIRGVTGTVQLGGTDISRVPTHRRGIAVLQQRPLLFNHFDVLDNVAFGPRSHGASGPDARRRARAALSDVDAEALAGRRVGTLSGGEAQRVALARALVTEPRLILLDEPMAALDAAVAPTVRHLLQRSIRHASRTAVLVTHDLLDVLTLCDDLAVMEGGRIVETGSTANLLSRPRSGFLATLMDVNLLSGVAIGPDAIALPGGEVVTGMDDGSLEPGKAGFAVIPPAAVSVHKHAPGGSPRNVLPVTIGTVELRGGLARVTAFASDGQRILADVTAAAAVELALTPGAAMAVAFKAVQVTLH